MSRFLRFYLPELGSNAEIGSEVTLDGAEAHHALRVLRLSIGKSVSLFDGSGLEANANIIATDKKSLRAEILTTEEADARGPELTLALAPMKGDFDDVLVRLAEMGVSKVIPLMTRFTEVDLTRKDAEKFREKMLQLSIRAAKQSGLNWLMEISAQMPIEALQGDAMICLPEAEASLTQIPLPDQGAQNVVIIGPEGGFNDKELALAKERNWQPVKLAGGVLRAGTAAIAAAAVLVNRFGN